MQPLVMTMQELPTAPAFSPLVAAGERSPLLLGGHRLFDSAVVSTMPALAVAVAVAAALRQ